jgi:hypothetical protein
MHAVVSFLDRKNDRTVRTLWKQLERAFGIDGVYRTPYPHFSYQGASHYDLKKLESRLQRFASRAKRLTVHAGGLGVFTGFTPVIYIPIVRTLELSRFHEALWNTISPNASRISPHYKPEFWTPHITLAQLGIDGRNLRR